MPIELKFDVVQVIEEHNFLKFKEKTMKKLIKLTIILSFLVGMLNFVYADYHPERLEEIKEEYKHLPDVIKYANEIDLNEIKERQNEISLISYIFTKNDLKFDEKSKDGKTGVFLKFIYTGNDTNSLTFYNEFKINTKSYNINLYRNGEILLSSEFLEKGDGDTFNLKNIKKGDIISLSQYFDVKEFKNKGLSDHLPIRFFVSKQKLTPYHTGTIHSLFDWDETSVLLQEEKITNLSSAKLSNKKVYINNELTPLQGYNIDNEDYFKIRDVQSILSSKFKIENEIEVIPVSKEKNSNYGKTDYKFSHEDSLRRKRIAPEQMKETQKIMQRVKDKNPEHYNDLVDSYKAKIRMLSYDLKYRINIQPFVKYTPSKNDLKPLSKEIKNIYVSNPYILVSISDYKIIDCRDFFVDDNYKAYSNAIYKIININGENFMRMSDLSFLGIKSSTNSEKNIIEVTTTRKPN